MTDVSPGYNAVAPLQIIRGTICHLIGDPFAEPGDAAALETFDDGGVACDPSGRIVAVGPFALMAAGHPGATILDRRGCFILPGFVDCHIHLPQALMIGAFGEELLDWLKRHARPEETRYRDLQYATEASRLFFEQEIRHGTTTALIFGPHFEEAIAAAFSEAERRHFRAVMGLTLEDRDLPVELATDPGKAYSACKRVIERWHNRGKLRYAVTPRFILTCSPELLRVCRRLLDEHPDVYFQTHLNENHKEVARLKELFPEARSYLDAYDRFGLLGPRSFFHHSIFSSDEEIDRLSGSGSRVVHCPSSNMFLGSGLIPLRKYVEKGVLTAVGTDVGGGTGYGMLKELKDAYQIQSLLMFGMERPDLAVKLTGVKLLYLSTLAGAKALGMEKEIGSFAVGKAMDLIVLDPSADPYLEARLKNTTDIFERLFVLAVLADKQVIREVYIDGKKAYACCDQTPAAS